MESWGIGGATRHPSDSTLETLPFGKVSLTHATRSGETMRFRRLFRDLEVAFFAHPRFPCAATFPVEKYSLCVKELTCRPGAGLHASFENFSGYILKDRGLYQGWFLWHTGNVTDDDCEIGTHLDCFERI